MTATLNELWSAVAALITILAGIRINARVRPLAQYNIPPAVTGGLIVAILLAVLDSVSGVKVQFADALRNALLLVFFASLGLTAKLRAIASGGRAVIGMCVLIAILAFSQSAVGAAVASLFGQPPALGVFLGSVAFLGGHGTTVAWAEAELAVGLPNALEIGLVCATSGLVSGAIAAGIVGTRLAEGVASVPAGKATLVAAADPAPWPESPYLSDRWLRALLWLGISIALGLAARPLASTHLGVTTPAFLAVLLAAVVVTNIADLVRVRVDLVAIDLLGTLALRVFLAVAMMGLKLLAIGSAFAMISVAVVCQVVLTSLLATLAVRRLLGGRDGAVGAAGFIGFGLGAMPVGLAAMKRLTESYGDAPRALLVITLAGSLFTDTANALIVQFFLTLFGAEK